MTNSQLVKRLALLRRRRRNKEVYETPIVPCRPWVKRSQALIKRMVARPTEIISVNELIEHVTNWKALGFFSFKDLNTGAPRFSHNDGDLAAIEILVGLRVGADVEYQTRQAQIRAMLADEDALAGKAVW